MSVPVVLRGASLLDGTCADVWLADGLITKISHADDHPGDKPDDWMGLDLDLDGFLLLPAPAEPHAHFDKILTADCLANPAGDLDGAVAAWYGYRESSTGAELLQRGRRAAGMFLDSGATAVRTHVDVGDSTGCRLLEPLLELRDELRPMLDLQIVAMVDVPVSGKAGIGNVAALRRALEIGADIVGGAPYRDPDPLRCQRQLLDIAADFNVPIDLHTDETLDEDVFTLASLPAQRAAAGLKRAVVASHCVSLGVQQPGLSVAVAAELAGANIAVVACPATNLYLQARGLARRPPRGLTAVSTLRAAGVLLAAGGDNIADPFYPLGRADPLETAALMVSAGHLSPDEAYLAVSVRAREAMGLPSSGICVGAPAELLAVQAATVRAALANPITDRMVFRRGELVSTTRVTRTRPGLVDASGKARP